MILAIGCPIFEREWIFERWADSVEAQTWPEGTDVLPVFAYTQGRDDTLGAIRRRFPNALVVPCADLPAFPDRDDPKRYVALSTARNRLLDAVQKFDADFFLSWDSDMLFGPVLDKLFIDKPVVGALVDMLGEDWLLDQGHGFPSWMWLDGRGEGAKREPGWVPSDAPHPFRVGVVMGTVLMNRDVIAACRYAPHPQGEDIGFAYACELLGFEQWLVPAARGEHVHDRQGERSG